LSARLSAGSRIPSRTTVLLVVAAVYGLAGWLLWRVRAPMQPEVETFASVLFFIPEAASSRSGTSVSQISDQAPRRRPAGHASSSLTASPGSPAHSTRQSPLVLLPPPADSGTAITLPTTAGANVDWTAQLAGAANAALDQEQKARKRLDTVTRKFVVEEPDPRNPTRVPSSAFRWYDAGIHRIDTRGPLPVLHLNDHCVMILFIMPACLIGHIDIHGDLFEGAAAAHDARLATPGPNDVP
jgi:hypothetical protein